MRLAARVTQGCVLVLFSSGTGAFGSWAAARGGVWFEYKHLKGVWGLAANKGALVWVSQPG
ncbi:hypothetical protein Tco_0406570, partial [Tanacetum coccineum]